MAGNNGGKRNGLNVIGKPYHKVDAKVKCTGELKYADDLVIERIAFTSEPSSIGRGNNADVTGRELKHFCQVAM